MEDDKEKGTKLTTWLYLRKYHIIISLSLLLFIYWTLRPNAGLPMPESFEGCMEQMSQVSCCKNDELKNNLGSTWWNGDLRNKKLQGSVDSILDIGTYPGADFKYLHELYRPAKHVGHEQVVDWANSLREKYSDDPTVTIRSVCDAAIPGETRTVIANGEEHAIMTKDFYSFFKVDGFLDNGLSLLHMDCDGCELDVLRSIAAHELGSKIDVLQFSTHKVSDDAPQRYCKAIMSLKATHTRVEWSPWSWERWIRNE